MIKVFTSAFCSLLVVVSWAQMEQQTLQCKVEKQWNESGLSNTSFSIQNQAGTASCTAMLSVRTGASVTVDFNHCQSLFNGLPASLIFSKIDQPDQDNIYAENQSASIRIKLVGNAYQLVQLIPKSTGAKTRWKFNYSDTPIVTTVSKPIQPADNIQKTTPEPSISEKKGERTIHVIQKDENMWRLSVKYGCSVDDIKRWNNLSSARVYTGQKLVLYHTGTVSAVDASKEEVAKTTTIATQKAISEIEKKYDALQDENKKLQNELKSEKNNNEQLQAKLENKSEKPEKDQVLQQQYDELTLKYSELKEQKETPIDSSAKVKAEAAKLQFLFNNLMKKHNMLRVSFDSVQKAQSELIAKQSEQETKPITNDETVWKSEYEYLLKEHAKLKGENEHLQKQLKSVSSAPSGPLLTEESKEKLVAFQQKVEQVRDQLANLRTQFKTAQQEEGKPTIKKDVLPHGEAEIRAELTDTLAFSGFCQNKITEYFSDSGATEKFQLKEYFYFTLNENGEITEIADERTEMNENTSVLSENDLGELKQLKFYPAQKGGSPTEVKIPSGIVVDVNKTDYRVKISKKKIRVYRIPLFVEHLSKKHAHHSLIMEEFSKEVREYGHYNITILDGTLAMNEYLVKEYNPFAEKHATFFQQPVLSVVKFEKVKMGFEEQ